MPKLAKQGAAAETATALTTNEYTRNFSSNFVKNGVIEYSIAGTFNSATITLQVSYDGGANFVTYAAKDATGTMANVTYTVGGHDCVYGPGRLFRFACTGGSSPSINIEVNGDVVLFPKT